MKPEKKKHQPKRKPSGGKVGPPRLDIDEEKLFLMARMLCTWEEMAAEIGCDSDTLRNNYSDKIEKERNRGRASLRRKQFATAMEGNVTMMIWLGKNQLGQKDKVEHTGSDDGPMQIVVKHV